MAKILAVDIEASNLSADFGVLLTFGYSYVGSGKVHVLNILDYGKDRIRAEKRLLKRASEVLNDSDVWLTHYGARGRYDTNFIQSRLLYHGLPILPPNHAQVDTWKISRDFLRLHSNRLNSISEFLKTTQSKTPIKPEQWIRAMSGDRRAMRTIIEHNRHDIEVLIEVYERIKPLMNNHPNVSIMNGKSDGCYVCGSSRLINRGWYYTKTKRYRQFRCKDCGSWPRLTKSEPL